MTEITRLESISPQNRPLNATPDDVVIGTDELGGTLYRSSLTGEEYTLYPEKKTPQERPIVSAAKAVGEYISDPSLPSLEETSEFAKEAVKGAYEPFRKVAHGDNPTYGDLLQVIPTGAVGNMKSKLFSKEAVPEPVSEPVLKFNEILFDEADFETLDADFTPVTKEKPAKEPAYTSPFEPEDQPDFLLGGKQTPEKVLKSIKDYVKADAEDYDEFTWTGAAARDKQKILKHYKDKELLKLAEDLPHYEDISYGPYLENVIKPAAKYLGVDKSNFMSLLSDLEIAFPPKPNPALEGLAEKPLPHKAPIGQRAAKDAPARPSDPKAEALGFQDTVYHTSVSPEEFTQFDLDRGFVGQSRAAQDLLGVHVGTARAAAERNFQAVRSNSTPQGFTMELRARTTDPVTKEELARMFGYAPEDIFSPGNKPLTEGDIGEAISIYEDMLFKDKERPQDSRDIAAVALRRELAREGFTHIPYINDVEDTGSTSLIMLVDRPKDSPAVLRDVRAQFDPKKVTSPDLRFAEGGMVEDDQMNRLMQEGGMADDGIAVEPVTGNEVPPGSLASEVRDDVDVKLSEGEYVVPADVVRFFGVKFFEDLRSQAKRGLSEMDSEGRIGGNAVTPEGVPVDNLDEELTPEEEQMLAEAMAMPGMAEGGVVTDNLERTSGSTFDRSQFTLGSAATGIESRKYINPTTKEERTFQFIGGMPLGIIPEGFVPWTADLAKKTEPEKPAEEVVKPVGEKGGFGKELGGDTGSGSDPYAGWAGENAAAISADPFGFGMEALGKTNASEEKKGLMGLVGGLLGGTVVGKIGGLIGDAKALDAISDAQVALSRLDPSSEQAKTLKDAIEAATNNLDTGLLGKLADLDLVATGKQKMKAYEAYLNEVENPLSMSNVRQQVSSGTFDPKSYVSGYESRNEGRGGYFGSKEYSKGLSQTAASYSAAARGDASAIGPDYDPYSDASIWGNAEESSTSKGSGSAGGSKDWSGGGGKDTGATGATGAGAGVGRRAKGGLITRPKKPTPKKKKGLAS